MTTAYLDFSIAFESSGEIVFPFSSFSSSLKAIMPSLLKASYRRSANVLRVSSPLKLMKTSYFHLPVEDEEEEEEEELGKDDKAVSMSIKAIRNNESARKFKKKKSKTKMNQLELV